MRKFIIVAAIAAFSLQAQAQIVSSRSSMVTRQVYDEPKNYTGWSTFGIEYLPSTFSYDSDSESFTSLAINWTKAASLSQSTPLFLEWGIGAQYSFYSEDDFKINYASVKVPINLIYDFEIPNTNINIDPFVGIKMRGNVWGVAKNDYYDEDLNLFDKDECDWNRFQLGWNIGVKARFNNRFFVGVAYGTDFMEMTDDMTIGEFSLSAGLVF